jgi:predicted transcriptional regulator of viral defense system
MGDCSEQLNMFDGLSMDSDSLMVLGIIKRHGGKERAVSVERISAETKVAPRQVREIVKGLIEKHRVRIGSSLRSPNGYYMIQTPEEAEENEKTLRRLGISILVRAAVLRGLEIEEYLRKVQREIGI